MSEGQISREPMPFADFMKGLGAPRRAEEPPEIRAVLRDIARQMESDACVLWESSLNFSPAPAPPKGQLYAIESTLEEKVRVEHASVPADPVHDFSARYLRGDESKPWDNDFLIRDSESKSRSVMERLGLRRVCTSPLEMGSFVGMPNLEEGDGLGAKIGMRCLISVYRNNEQVPFNREDADTLAELAGFVPHLYGIHTYSKAFDLFQGVRNELRVPRLGGSSLANRKVLNDVCQRIRKVFRCQEVSIFLRDPEGAADRFKLMGTTYQEDKIGKKEYRGKKSEGLTGWVLNERKPVLIPDLARFDDQIDEIRRLYKDMQWNDSGRVFHYAADFLKLAPGDLPPMSFMACPVHFGSELFGCIRCAIGTDPYYFSWGGELRILVEIAAFLAEAWAQEVEKELWHCLLASIGKQTEAFRKQIGNEDYDQTRLYLDAVEAINRERFRGCQIISFRIIDALKPDQAKLMAVEAAPEIYSSNQIAGFRIRPKLFNAENDGRSTISKLLHADNGSTSRVFDINQDGDPDEKTFFKAAPYVLSAPVMIDKRRHGVFDLAFSERDALMSIHPQLSSFAEMFARNLALHEFRFEQQRHFNEFQAIQTQAYANVSHQLRSPLRTMMKRVEDLAERLNNPNFPRGFTVEHELPVILGQCRKAARVTSLLNVFAKISRGERITAKMQRTSLGMLWKSIFESLIDNHRYLGRPRGVYFDADQLDAFRKACNDTRLFIDMAFSEQAVGELVVNAFKYTAPGKIVDVHGALEEGFFVFSVISRGVWLSEADTALCTQRFWRSEEAADVDADGTGLGLFLTNLLMRAQGGKFTPEKTNSAGETHMLLHFPIDIKL